MAPLLRQGWLIRVARSMGPEWYKRALTQIPRVIVFAEVARQGSFSKAATEVGLSRSTVSHHISNLEKALGVRLLERTTRAVRLTEAGRELNFYAVEILQQWRDGVERTQAHTETGIGTLTLTCPGVLCQPFVADAVASLASQYPALHVIVRTSPANFNLIEDNIDVAVRAGPLPDSGHGARRLVEADHIIVANPRLAAKWEAVAAPADLSSAPWVEFASHGSRLKRFFGSNGRELTVEQRAAVVVTSSMAYLAFTLSGLGFALLPSFLVAEHIAAGRLVRVLSDWNAGPITFYAVTPSPRPTDEKVRRFIEILAAQFE